MDAIITTTTTGTITKITLKDNPMQPKIKQDIIDRLTAAMAEADAQGEPWADAIDGMNIHGYECFCDQSVDGWEGGYYICSLRRLGRKAADVWVSGDTLSIDEA